MWRMSHVTDYMRKYGVYSIGAPHFPLTLCNLPVDVLKDWVSNNVIHSRTRRTTPSRLHMNWGRAGYFIQSVVYTRASDVNE